jgi:hypothetical protein
LANVQATDLIRDEGYIEVKRALVRDPVDRSVRRHAVIGSYVKTLDFADGPYGGPGVTDLVAPSYVGSWVRVQLDLWASRVQKAVEAKRRDGSAPAVVPPGGGNSG